MRRGLLPFLSCALLALACRRERPAASGSLAPSALSVPTDGAGGVSFSPHGEPREPLVPKAPRTTDPAIAIGNFEGQHASALAAASRPNASVEALAAASTSCLAAAQSFGRIAELARGVDLAERAYRLAPRDPRVLAARVAALAAVHRFDDALAALEGLVRSESPAAKVRLESTRAAILEAEGRYAEARPFRERMAALAPSTETLGALAALDADEGRLDEAAALYVRAAAAVRDPSPFPVAWLYFQEGLMWQRAGRPARARELFAAARERLPAYAAAVSHEAATLWQVGDRTRAIALLRPLADGGDDPEPEAELATLLAQAGDEAEARRRYQHALAAYDGWMRQLGEVAFADHAARVRLARGAPGDAVVALSLAEKNLTARRTAEALSLVAEAALAAGRAARACEAIRPALALAPPAAPIQTLAWKAFTACGDATAAAAALARLELLARE